MPVPTGTAAAVDADSVTSGRDGVHFSGACISTVGLMVVLMTLCSAVEEQ